MDVSSPEFMVYKTLQCACSQDAELLKPAESKLATWETEPGFYTTLLQILADQTLDGGARWMATVCLKNGVTKYWRRNCPNEISAEEKAAIKSWIISSFQEPTAQIAVQMAVVIAKIARWEGQVHWPELIPRLVEAIRGDNQLQQYQAMLVFQHVAKALATKRLATERRDYEQLTQNVYSFILNLWDGFTNLYFNSVQSGIGQPAAAQEYLEKSILALKILKKLTIFGFNKPTASDECMMFIKALFQRLKESLQCRLQVRGQPNLLELTEKFIIKMMTILIEFLENHPMSAIDHIPMMLDFSFTYAFNDGATLIFEDNRITFETFAIKCINLMKGIISTTQFNNSRPLESSNKSAEVQNAIDIRNEFFTQERISFICEKIVLYYFLLTPAELEVWDDDPESYALDDGGDSWKYSLRACAETFYLTLFAQSRNEMCTETIKHLRVVQQTPLTESSSLQEILVKDAVYNAIGLTSFNLFDDIDFDQWFTGQLIAESRLRGSNFRIIRRRVIWLIGHWTGVKFSQALRPQAYALCLELLSPAEDMSVRLAASHTLLSSMEDFEFASESFLPFLEPSFSLLFNLLKEAKECDTKMNVLNIMSFMVDRMSENIDSEVDKLIQYLPMLWEESANHNMLRCAIIATLLQILKAVNDIPAQLAPFLYPVIRMSTNVNEPAHIYLLEEGLDLWQSVIEHNATLTPELLALADNILPIIEITSENLKAILYIIQSYITLDADQYLQKHGLKVVACLQYLLTDLRPEGIVMIMKVFDTMVKNVPEYGLELIRPVLPYILKNIYGDEHYPMVMTVYLTAIGRTLIINPVTFSEALQSLDALPQPLERILDVWLTKMPLITQLERKKLLSISLCRLITVQNDAIYERLGLVLCRVCETLNDIMKEDNQTGALYDSLMLAHTLPERDEPSDTYHYKRQQSLMRADPAYTTVLKDCLQSQLVALKHQLGGERYQTFMQSVDTSVLINLTDFIDIGIPVPDKSN